MPQFYIHFTTDAPLPDEALAVEFPSLDDACREARKTARTMLSDAEREFESDDVLVQVFNEARGLVAAISLDEVMSLPEPAT